MFSSIFPNAVSDPPTADDVLGALSLIVWSLILVFVLKYAVFVLAADDHGEGGTLAIFALIQRSLKQRLRDEARFSRVNYALGTVAMLGVACVLADGMLTPAITVLGAAQGLSVVEPSLDGSVVIGVACAVLVALFTVQKWGTETVSFLFSPVMVAWFASLVAVGGYNLASNPSVLSAFSPAHGVDFMTRRGFDGFSALGSVFLTVCGVEALALDMGHFTADAVRIAAITVVAPSLIVCYCGQAAAISANPALAANAFYATTPQPALVFMIVLASLAAAIASQAMISASFTVTNQAVKLSFFPRVNIVHTSRSESRAAPARQSPPP